MAFGWSRAGELERLKRAGLAGIRMTFAGPGKRDDELEAGIDAGATISVESEGEAGRAIHAGERVGIQPKLAVRVNPPFSIDGGRLTLGAQAEPVRSRCRAGARRWSKGLLEAGVDWRGLHMFAAAQCLDDEALIEAHKAIIACAGEIVDALGIPLARAQPRRRLRRALLRRRAADRRLPHGRSAARDLVQRAELLATTRLSLELGRWLVGEVRRLSDPVLDRPKAAASRS